jgi:hypothetical protein
VIILKLFLYHKIENFPGKKFPFPTPAEQYCLGKRRIFEGGKENSLGKFFSTFLSLG